MSVNNERWHDLWVENWKSIINRILRRQAICRKNNKTDGSFRLKNGRPRNFGTWYLKEVYMKRYSQPYRITFAFLRVLSIYESKFFERSFFILVKISSFFQNFFYRIQKNSEYIIKNFLLTFLILYRVAFWIRID